MNNPVSSPGSGRAAAPSAVADMVRRSAGPSTAVARGGFEAVISDRGVDLARETEAAAPTRQAAAPTRIETTPPAAAPAVAESSSPPAEQEVVMQPAPVGPEATTRDLTTTYNARGRLAAPVDDAPQSRLLDITG